MANRAAVDEPSVHRGLLEWGAVSKVEAPSDRSRVMTFRVAIFVEQLVYQVFFPLSVPLIYAIRGHAAVLNMRFLPSSEQSYISMFQYMLAACMFTAIAICFAVPAEASVSWYAMLYEMAMVLIGGIFQRMMVATKYAYVPKDEYQYIMRTRVPLAKLQADQLLVGWWALSHETMHRELTAAAGRLSLDADATCFPMADTAVRELLTKLAHKAPAVQRQAAARTSVSLPDGAETDDAKRARVATQHVLSSADASLLSARDSVVVSIGRENPLARVSSRQMPVRVGEGLSCKELLSAVLFHSDASSGVMGAQLMRLLFLACLLESTLPIIIRAAAGAPPVGTSAAYTVAFVCCTYCRFWFLYTILAYLVVCVIDYRRRCNSLRRLTKLMARGHKTAERAGRRVSLFIPPTSSVTTTPMSSFPMLQLDTPEAVVAWLATRRLLMEFGLRFFYRLQAYVTEALILIVGIAIGIIGALSLTGTSRSSPSRVADLTFATVALLDLILLAGVLLITLRYGANANFEKEQHAGVLLARALELQQSAAMLARGPDPNAATHAVSMLRTAEVLRTAERALQSDNVLAPIRIAGVTADYTVLNTLLAAAASAATVAGRLLLQVYVGS